jgi:hypothetical protein
VGEDEKNYIQEGFWEKFIRQFMSNLHSGDMVCLPIGQEGVRGDKFPVRQAILKGQKLNFFCLF